MFFLVATAWVTAQDLHFSQPGHNPALVNPALTGAEHAVRIGLCNRDQWRSITSPYRTSGVSAETRFKASEWQQVDKFRTMTFTKKATGRLAAGLSVYSDRAGDGNLGHTQANLSLASFVPLNRRTFFSLGLQGSVAQKKIDVSKLVFPDQYSGRGYDPSMASGETAIRPSFTYFDFSAGAAWSYVYEEKKMIVNEYQKAFTGLAVYHLARPQQDFFSQSSRLHRRYVLFGTYEIGIPYRQYAIVPTFLVQLQGPSKEIIAGSAIKHRLKADSKYTGYVRQNYLSYGVGYRTGDALIVSWSLEWKEQYMVCLSYDVNVSRLSQASMARGGMEITLRYTSAGAYLYQKKEKEVGR